MRINDQIDYSQGELEAFCRRHHIRKLSFFGSVLAPGFDAASDVDVLVDFEPTGSAGLLRLGAMELELSTIVGRRADLRTPAELSRYFREQVTSSAQVQYEA